MQTQQSSWEAPAELTKDDIMMLPGAHYLSDFGSGSKPKQIRASHLLVKHSGSRRPSSWKDVRNHRFSSDARVHVHLIWLTGEHHSLER